MKDRELREELRAAGIISVSERSGVIFSAYKIRLLDERLEEQLGRVRSHLDALAEHLGVEFKDEPKKVVVVKREVKRAR